MGTQALAAASCSAKFGLELTSWTDTTFDPSLFFSPKARSEIGTVPLNFFDLGMTGDTVGGCSSGSVFFPMGHLSPGAGGASGTHQAKDNSFAGPSPGNWAHFLKSLIPAKFFLA